MKALPMMTVAVLLVGSAYVAADARQQSVFRAETNYIEVVASVTDRDGRFVTGLTAADFEIREQGRRESVDSFTFVELPVSGGAATAPAVWSPGCWSAASSWRWARGSAAGGGGGGGGASYP